MTVKLALLKSGEDVIADIQEMTIGEGDTTRVIGYFFENPCVVKILAKTSDNVGEETKTPCKLQLTPWMPLTNDSRIPLPPDWVVTIVEPVSELKELYKKGMLKNVKNNKDSSTNQQSDSNQSD
jgi:hypothetical protein